MLDNGKATIDKAWGYRSIYLKSNITKEIILMIKRTAMVFGRDLKDKFIWENGNKIKNKGSGNIMMEKMNFITKVDGKKT